MSRQNPFLAVIALAALGAGPAPAVLAQAIAVDPGHLESVLRACTDPQAAACRAAIRAVLAAFPDLPPSMVVGILAAEFAALSNAGTAADAGALASALAALSGFASASLGLTGLGDTIAAIGLAVAAGETVDVGAIASGDGDGDGAPDRAASAG